MANSGPVRTEQEYQAALTRIREIFHAEEGTPEGDELEMLVDLVEIYAAEHYPIDPPSPIAAIEYYLDQRGVALGNLIPFNGERAKITEDFLGKWDWRTSLSLPTAQQ